ncbi:glycosyltransferase [Chryseobacterium sp.]|uniref:glycosyltransferase n=1 Tax=Chryseobacterium sp. TaxID=1871047 RepID=UPI00289A3D0E|nr:glycosyltransferase [Chryseobacterium sp.]
MLSIIISSYQPSYYEALVKNIQETIGDGFIYEIIQIWNPNMMSITKAYNSGAEKSQYENLLFLHEDVIFHTENWGSKLIQHLSMENVGIIGVSGSNYVPSAPSSWTTEEKYHFINILETDNSGTTYTHSTKKHTNEVYGVDGVFLACKKSTIEKYKFNESLEGFHGYDLDLALRVSLELQNYTIDNILIEHFSRGKRTKQWLDSLIFIRKNIHFKKQRSIDSQTEFACFSSFLYIYFTYYPVSVKNIFFTLRFYPYKKITLEMQFALLKKYFYYFIYSKKINTKLK